ETVDCRRQQLLAYFGQDIASCGNCDTCLEPPESWDGTVAAQKLLSAIFRLWRERGQRYGAGHIIDILRGKLTPRVRENEHDSLSVLGVGAELGEQAWRGVLRHLLAEGLVTVDFEGHGTLLLTDDSRAVLKGERTLMLRREAVSAGRTTRVRRQAAVDTYLAPDEQLRFETLRAWRAEVAREHGVPAYVIFHDATLREIARGNPQSLEALSHVHGVGLRKLEAYGEALLECVAEA